MKLLLCNLFAIHAPQYEERFYFMGDLLMRARGNYCTRCNKTLWEMATPKWVDDYADNLYLTSPAHG